MLDLLHGYFRNSFDLIPLQFLNQTNPVKQKKKIIINQSKRLIDIHMHVDIYVGVVCN